MDFMATHIYTCSTRKLKSYLSEIHNKCAAAAAAAARCPARRPWAQPPHHVHIPTAAAPSRPPPRYGRPVWLTEFSCPNPRGPASRTATFLTKAVDWLDAQPWLERYAWFTLDLHAFSWIGAWAWVGACPRREGADVCACLPLPSPLPHSGTRTPPPPPPPLAPLQALPPTSLTPRPSCASQA